MQKIKFYDENTRRWWIPETGGANIPAINDLLYSNWGVAFGDDVRSGQFTLGQHAPITFASGTTLIRYRILYIENRFKKFYITRFYMYPQIPKRWNHSICRVT